MSEKFASNPKASYQRGWLEVGYGEEGGHKWRKIIGEITGVIRQENGGLG